MTAFQVAGLYLWFNSNDHLPLHFHAEKADEWEVTVRFLRTRENMIKIEWSEKKVPKAALKKLCAMAEAHRAALLVEREQKVLTKTAGQEE